MSVSPASPTFLDAGCGIGTKALLAQAAGCRACGVEHDPVLLAQAHRLGVTATLGDVRAWDHSGYDIVYVNCPLVADVNEADYERAVYAQMDSGAVAVMVNFAVPPAGWPALIDESAAWRGVWVKP